jgi:radical SAM superfamily enzyme YgiQ (UPF0313 family)
MTYWYLGVKEVIEDLRRYTPQAVIVLGGIYATLCQAHAGGLEADVVIEGNELDPLRRIVPLADSGMPYRNSSMGSVAAFKLTDGCPFRCTYCSVPLHHPRFSLRPVDECLEEARWLAASGVQHLAFYDDALLFQPEDTLIPFLQDIVRRGPQLAFHTPNALNVRLLTQEIADLMVRAGCCTFFLGFESRSPDWLSKTGGKSSAKEFASAVARLRRAQAQFIIAYIIIGHPDADEQEVEAAMHYAHQQGARILLSEFAPVPGTIDGDRCGKWADMTEPLAHNKTAFTLRRLGAERVRHLKALCRDLNSSLTHRPPSFRDSTSE